MPTISDIITNAATEIRVARGGDVLAPDDADYLLRLFNRLLDSCNADRRAVYNNSFFDFTLIPNFSPHTIGPGGDFVTAQRPVALDYAAVDLGGGGSTSVFVPIRVRDDAWYQRQPVPNLTITFPTDVYYSKDWPLGQLFFWGIPTTAYQVRLWMRVLLAAVALTDTFSLPPGYEEYLTLQLAMLAAPSFGQVVSPDTKEAARLAGERIFNNNDDEPWLATADAGIPGRSTGVPSFNYHSRGSST